MSEKLRNVMSRLEKQFKFSGRVFDIEQRINFFQRSEQSVAVNQLITALDLYRQSLDSNLRPSQLKLLVDEVKKYQSGINYMDLSQLDTLSYWHLGYFNEQDSKKFIEDSIFRQDFPDKAREFLRKYAEDVFISYFFSKRKDLSADKRQQLMIDLLDFLNIKRDTKDYYEKLSVKRWKNYPDEEILSLFILLDQLRQEKIFFGFEIFFRKGFDKAIEMKEEVLRLVESEELKKFLRDRWVEIRKSYPSKEQEGWIKVDQQIFERKIYFDFSDIFLLHYQKYYPYKRNKKILLVDFLRPLKNPRKIKKEILSRLLISRLSSDNDGFNWVFGNVSAEKKGELKKVESVFEDLILGEKSQDFFNQFKKHFFSWLNYQPNDEEKKEGFLLSEYLTSRTNEFIIRGFFENFFNGEKRFSYFSYLNFLKKPGLIESLLAARKLLVLRLIRDYLPEKYRAKNLHLSMIGKQKINPDQEIHNLANYIFEYHDWPSLKSLYQQLKRQKRVDFGQIDLTILGRVKFSDLLKQLVYFYTERQFNIFFGKKKDKENKDIIRIRKEAYENFLKTGVFNEHSKKLWNILFPGFNNLRMIEGKIFFGDIELGSLSKI